MRTFLFLIGLLITALFFYYCISNNKFGIQGDIQSRVAAATELPDSAVLNVDAVSYTHLTLPTIYSV